MIWISVHVLAQHIITLTQIRTDNFQNNTMAALGIAMKWTLRKKDYANDTMREARKKLHFPVHSSV